MTAHPIDTTARTAVEHERAGTAYDPHAVGYELVGRYGKGGTVPPLERPYVMGEKVGDDVVPLDDPRLPDQPRIGSFMQTYTGRAVYPMDLRPDDICIEDIAHSLAHQCRYNGHCQRFYSVAEHSVLIARHLREKHSDAVALEGLLHDATEAYLADVPRPVKPFLVGYKEAEERATLAVAHAYSLSPIMHPAVHEADNRILHDERQQNMAPSAKEWGLSGVRLGVRLEFWSPERAKAEFLALFEELYGEE